MLILNLFSPHEDGGGTFVSSVGTNKAYGMLLNNQNTHNNHHLNNNCCENLEYCMSIIFISLPRFKLQSAGFQYHVPTYQTPRCPVAYPGILFGGVSTNSVEDRENRDLGVVAP
jgi:hypothetical protein